MAFQSFEENLDGLGYKTIFAGFKNFRVALDFLKSTRSLDMIKYSLIFYAISLLVVTPLALIFSYYIVKKYRCSEFFRVMLYLPSVVSSVVLAILYKYIVTNVYMVVFNKEAGLFDASVTSQYIAVLVYALFIAYGANVMLYSGAMSGINEQLIESAQLDGAKPFQEFIYIYVPMIWPTIVTFIITGLAGLFGEQMYLYTFFADTGVAKFEVFGYYFYKTSARSSMYASGGTGVMNYSELASLGIIITIILVPLTLGVRKLLNTYGPREN